MVQFGVHYAPRAETMDVRALGRLLEDAGFASLWLPEHTHLRAGATRCLFSLPSADAATVERAVARVATLVAQDAIP